MVGLVSGLVSGAYSHFQAPVRGLFLFSGVRRELMLIRYHAARASTAPLGRVFLSGDTMEPCGKLASAPET